MGVTPAPAAESACLVVMFKSPARSKRRLAAQIGAPAEVLASHLLNCVGEDIDRWRGPVRYAPATQVDADWLLGSGLPPHPFIVQGDGNLGERIAGINQSLLAEGLGAQIFIGIDCPSLGPAYLESAAAALTDDDVVLGPASDGGVVMMAVNGQWPDLAALPWSEPVLCAGLIAACHGAGLRCTSLETLDDVDSVDDLERVRVVLDTDARSARRALCSWIDHSGSLAPGATH